ncbi:hypothetical protein GIY23_03390 [Allosaccharopolyspora coralli]|uniref:Uncharacterized protein n=1 Tax=Allosaccharopolyspora coralli TaxID=2665642 RepID=A0A5Q3Q2D2_9PSEU|nr:hypothetical protein [Allosaccharopolyspora coralli]QGK68721.1 hypothetical protein GIY23_03390 [Allosaccharopolyspora coralli]
MSKKDFGSSRGAGAVGNRLAGRYAESRPDETSTSAPPAAEPPREKPRMVTRSWYLPAETAAHLTATADQLWRELPGTSKHEVLAALLEAGIAHSDDVRHRLSQTSQS